MTADEVKIVTDLQRRGLGYKKIASVTGISVNTVKTFCRRHRAETGTEVGAKDIPLAFCRNCGAALDLRPKRKPRQFCSDACRMKWWNSHMDEVDRKAWYTFVCPQCGKEFQSYGNRHRKYCSRKCVAEARRKGGTADEC